MDENSRGSRVLKQFQAFHIPSYVFKGYFLSPLGSFLNGSRLISNGERIRNHYFMLNLTHRLPHFCGIKFNLFISLMSQQLHCT